MVAAVPTLSLSGWVSSPAEKVDYLIAHFYESDYFQSFLYGNNISNLQAIVEQNTHDIPGMIQSLTNTLELYLGRYFDAVNATVEVTNDLLNSPSNSVSISIYCTLSQDGKAYSLGRLLPLANGKVEKVFKLNNG